MSKFDVGDKVRRINNAHGNFSVGDIGTIKAYKEGKDRYMLVGDKAGYLHDPGNLELVSAAASILAVEQDPNGTNPHSPGAKLDAGKTEFGLVLHGMPRALRQVARVATYGANKYTRDGWLTVPDGPRRYTDAMYRHLNAEACGELHDPDTQLEHAAHAAWNALARLELLLRGQGNA